MQQEDVVRKLRALELEYIQQSMGKNPGALPEHVGEYSGYATFVYQFYADKLEAYEILEGKVNVEERDNMSKINANVEKRNERMTVAEMQQRVDIRLAEEKGKKKRLEQIVRGTTLHVNVCQSLMKHWSNEAKGIM